MIVRRRWTTSYSMIATLRKVWGLGDAFTARDAAAAPFDHLLSRERPRDPASWPDVEALPVPEFHLDLVQMGKALSTLGKTAGGGIVASFVVGPVVALRL